MEPPQSLDRPVRSDGPPGPVAGSKVQRIVQHTQQLVGDLQEWVDLRIELAQMQLEERVEAKANEIALQVMVVGIVLLAVVFGLVTLALGLGAWLGHPAWGFLIVTVLLVGLAIVLRAAHPAFIQIGGGRRGSDEPAPPDASAPPEAPRTPIR